MQFAHKMGGIKPSATLSINAKVLEMKARGEKVISLAVGEPDFSTPPHVCEAAHKAIDEGFTHYTAVPGIPELRTAVAGYFQREYGVQAGSDNVIVSNGGKQSLFNLFMALLNPGDEVIIPAPYWVSYPDMVRLNDGIPVIVHAPAAQNFKITIDQLEAVRTPKSRILVFNSPSNPTGACYTQEESNAIAHWALKNNIFIISDEIYDQLVYAPAQKCSLSPFWEQHPEAIAVVNGLAKSFAMTGWRVGYTLAHPDLIKKLIQITGQSTANINAVAQKAALAALSGSYDCVHRMREAFQRRRDLGWKELSSWDKVICPRPDGAFYLFADVSAWYSPEMPDSTALCTMLLEKAGIALVPGSAFGDPDCVRLSYAVADDVLIDALSRIRKALLGR